MTIESDITEWALERPGWQQEVLVSLANGKHLSDDQIQNLVDQVLEPNSSLPSQEAKTLSIKSSVVEQVQLVEISGVHGVNALVEDQRLTTATTGLTVVYGDNASGKSGYARLIKGMVAARHAASVLPDVFKTNPTSPSASLRYSVAGVEKSQNYPAPATAEMLKMSFYDEHCGDEYLTKQSTISYRPSALVLLDGLIEICDRVRAAIQGRIAASQAKASKLDIAPRTTAGVFVLGLTAKTSNDQIDKAAKLAPNTNEQLVRALQEEARLTGSNPETEKLRLEGLATQLANLAAGVGALLTELSATRTAQRIALKTSASHLRAAAAIAASKSFENEPLPAVGSETWRALWIAARRYSSEYAYPDRDFPVTDGDAICVLCQQPLGHAALDRFQRFNRFMADTTELDALSAEQTFQSAVRALRDLVVISPQRSATITALSGLDDKLGGALEALVARIDEHRGAVLGHLEGDAELPPHLPHVDVIDKIVELGMSLRAQAAALDVERFKLSLAAATKRKEELQANIRLHDSAEVMKKEVARLTQLAQLQASKTAADTSSITQKSTQLTRQYATKKILDQFTRETDRLKLEKVTLEDLGGQKGQLNQRPALLGASHRDAHARSVLSEGEQTALGLAGFFTEAVFDESNSAIIFDDPVTSLDHVRRDQVANRLAQLAKDRQVVVFTHDVAFVADLSRAANHEGVPLAERSIERRGSQPGVCLSTFPWKAKDFSQRVADLQTDLQRLVKDRPSLGTTEYEERVASWAGRLSETWERSVSSEILDQVFDRGRSEVRVMKFRLFAGITEQDDKDFQEGYGSTSKWARRHDKAPVTNYVAPDTAELQSELDRIKAWQSRLKGYLK